MTPSVFADTAYYLALISPRDSLHAKALALSQALNERVVTSAWVVQELADGLCAPPARQGFLTLWETLHTDPNTTIIEPDVTLWRRGLTVYGLRPDKRWSLTDCISFEIMHERGCPRR